MTDQLPNSHTPPTTLPCSACHIGQMQPETVTYFTWLDEDLITVPDFAAWKCDICGHLEYDLAALNDLAQRLCPAGSQPAHPVPAQPAARRDQRPLAQPPSSIK